MIHGSGIPFYSKSTLYADKLLSMHQRKGDCQLGRGGQVDLVAYYLGPVQPTTGRSPSPHTKNHNLVPLIQEFFNDMRTDKTGLSGYNIFHDTILDKFLICI
jgi:hypothetical protein